MAAQVAATLAAAPGGAGGGPDALSPLDRTSMTKIDASVVGGVVRRNPAPAPSATRFLDGKRVLITGGVGLIGSALARRLAGLGAELVLLDSMVPEGGANPANIAPAINMAVAQRLVRRACKYCSFWRPPKEEEFEKIKKALNKIADRFKININSPELKIVEPKGCKFCNFSGYKGRVGIFEAILIDDEMENLILKSPSIPEIKKMALKNGMISMYQDGFLKIIQGMTTIEEVERMASE